MNPLLAFLMGLHAADRSLVRWWGDRRIMVCANCETENKRGTQCCKQCGCDYLIRRREFKAMQAEASGKREKCDDARRTLRRLQGVRQCPSCEREYAADHAHCTACGLPVVPLNATQVFRHMRKAHRKLIHTPEDVSLLAASMPAPGKGLVATVLGWFS